MKKDWKYEIARDSMAFGSILFYFIAIIRATIGEFTPFLYQLLIAIAILIISSFIIKNVNYHSKSICFSSIFKPFLQRQSF